jgi:hypothetical protein
MESVYAYPLLGGQMEIMFVGCTSQLIHAMLQNMAEAISFHSHGLTVKTITHPTIVAGPLGSDPYHWKA